MAPNRDLPPGGLIEYKEWLRLTAAIGRPRSADLKAVDEAVELCERVRKDKDFIVRATARWRLEGALRTWKEKAGPGDAWKKSVRNQNRAVERLTALLGTGDTNAAWGGMPDFMQPNFEHARLGVTYLLGHLEVRADIFSVLLEGGLSCAGSVMSYQGASVDDGGLGKASVDTAQNFFNSAIIPGQEILKAGAEAAPEAARSATGTNGKRLKEFFEKLAQKTLALLKEKFSGIEPTAAAIKNLVNLCCKLFWTTLGAGLVNAGMDTFKGIVTLADTLITRVRTYIAGKHVTIADGHPHAVVQSIVDAMTLAVMKGLWVTLKGVGNIGLAFATAGAGMIAGIVTALVEMVVKVIWRLVELAKMREVCEEAAEHWKDKDKATALHKHPFAFHHWYRDSVKFLPALAVITLNSGVCGDKMVYLSMFTSDDHKPGSEISAEQFQKGVEHLDALKPWGTEYLDDAGFSFESSDPVIKGLLAVGHQAQRSGAEKVWHQVVRFANA